MMNNPLSARVRQPVRLLFTDMPAACGFPPFATSGDVDAAQVESYFAVLRSAFSELQRAYSQLLNEIARLILTAFGQAGPLPAAQPKIEHEAHLVLNVAVDAKLKAFLLRAADAVTDDTTVWQPPGQLLFLAA